MRTLAASLLLLASTGAFATPMQDRAAAMEVFQQQAVVERIFSNCRFIRGESRPDLLKAWREDSLEFTLAAKRVVAGQGGLTAARQRILDSVATTFESQESSSRESCKAFFERVSKGEFELTTRIPFHVLKKVISTPAAEPSDTLWVVDQRRLPNGTLAHIARRWDGDGDIVDCDAKAAANGHIWTRTKLGPTGEPIKDPDPDLWMSECVAADVNPVTGKEAAELPPPT